MAVGARLPPKISICPRRYGLRCERNWRIDPLDEHAFSTKQLIWVVDRGDVIFAGSELKKTIKLLFIGRELWQTTTITFVANSSDSIPHRLEDLTTGGKFDSLQSYCVLI